MFVPSIIINIIKLQRHAVFLSGLRRVVKLYHLIPTHQQK